MHDIIFTPTFFMQEALKQAQLAYNAGEVPVGAVIVCNETIIARAHNLTQRLNDVTAHAEIQAYSAATEFLNNKYLNDCTLYVTIEPCVMCAGALFWSQIGAIVFGASDPKRGFQCVKHPLLHPKTKLLGGVLEAECAALMQSFFSKKR
jgi:tRNA(adenine34) deaminase